MAPHPQPEKLSQYIEATSGANFQIPHAIHHHQARGKCVLPWRPKTSKFYPELTCGSPKPRRFENRSPFPHLPLTFTRTLLTHQPTFVSFTVPSLVAPTQVSSNQRFVRPINILFDAPLDLRPVSCPLQSTDPRLASSRQPWVIKPRFWPSQPTSSPDRRSLESRPCRCHRYHPFIIPSPSRDGPSSFEICRRTAGSCCRQWLQERSTPSGRQTSLPADTCREDEEEP